MVTYIGASGDAFSDYVGKSTDEKPNNAKNGDRFYEMDKVGGDHRLFMFDGDTKEWLLQ